MLSLHGCSERSWKSVQRMEMAGACRWGVVMATLGGRKAQLGLLNSLDVVEPAAAVKRAVSSMGGKAGWSRLGAVRAVEVEAGVEAGSSRR